ncbi:PPR domain-containing protein/PPR_2 domain-containing protein [Cephalotus follicularis]|uniref:PPR domain-containing protein/PPR_2 domain-containing protein n=1 Tax=Cephalotus follicularis TaxID=3775 RepID=A0A1Q3BLG8_CEPFO|nr:PPR domain-containing protein/PPR_2 domain-containing protein [Cephalotus follicularis]
MRAACKCFIDIFRCKWVSIPHTFLYDLVPARTFVSRFDVKHIQYCNQNTTVSYCFIVSKFITNCHSFNTQSFLHQNDEEILNQILAAIENAPHSCIDVCTVYIDKLCKAKNVNATVGLLQLLRNKNTFLAKNTYYTLLVLAGETKDFDLLCQVFKDLLVSCRFFLTSSCYLNLAKAFAKAKDCVQCVQLLKFVKDVSVIASPSSTIVVNRIIFSFAECGLVEEALLIFYQMEGFECQPDLITYNTVLDILGRIGRMDEMLHVFSSMKIAGFNPDFVSYNTLINNLRKVGRLDVCLVFFREMGERGIEPDLLTYTALIQSFGQSGNVEESIRLFNEMKLRKIRPSLYVFRSMIDSLKKMGKLDLATKYLEEMNSCLSDLAGPKDFKRKGR